LIKNVLIYVASVQSSFGLSTIWRRLRIGREKARGLIEETVTECAEEKSSLRGERKNK